MKVEKKQKIWNEIERVILIIANTLSVMMYVSILGLIFYLASTSSLFINFSDKIIVKVCFWGIYSLITATFWINFVNELNAINGK